MTEKARKTKPVVVFDVVVVEDEKKASDDEVETASWERKESR